MSFANFEGRRDWNLFCKELRDSNGSPGGIECRRDCFTLFEIKKSSFLFLLGPLF